MRDCSEGEDEAECGDEDRIQDELNLRYRMSRFNRYDDFYDNWDGDWAWLEANIDEDREQFVHVPVPETCDEWFFTAFSVSKVRSSSPPSPTPVSPCSPGVRSGCV